MRNRRAHVRDGVVAPYGAPPAPGRPPRRLNRPRPAGRVPGHLSRRVPGHLSRRVPGHLSRRVPGHLRRLPGRLSRRLLAAPMAALLGTSLAMAAAQAPAAALASAPAQAAAPAQVTGHSWSIRPDVLPTLRRNLVAFYDFEHPVPGNTGTERDQGLSRTNINLINGGGAMRVPDGAYPSSRHSIQTQQLNPTVTGNDDWKAGIYSDTGVPTLNAFNAAKQISIMGWFKTTGQNPNLNSTTPAPDDFFNAVGLAGVLSGNSQGHDVRALLEVINVSNVLRVVALGRRVDGSTVAGDPWAVAGDPEPDLTSATDPRGIKIGGSFPQNTEERNPCNCRFDGLMFLNRVVTPGEVFGQYLLATRHHG